MNKIVKTITVDVKPECTLNVNTDLFFVLIKKSETEQAVIKVELTSEKEIDFEEVVNVKYDDADNQLLIIADSSETDSKIFKAAIEINIPDVSNVEITSENGAIQLIDLVSKFKIQNGNGSNKIKNCSGEFIAVLENGSIKVFNSSGNFNIKSENGACKMTDVSGTLIVNQENGSVRIIKGLFENVDVKSENGSIYYEFLSIEKGAFNFKNENGKIQLIIPDDIDYDLVAFVENGSFHVGVDGDYTIAKVDSKKKISMVKGGGQVKILAENENGSLAILSEPLVAIKKNKDFWNPERKDKLESGIQAAKKALEKVTGKVTEKFSDKVEENVTEKFSDKFEKNPTRKKIFNLRKKLNNLNKSNFGKKKTDDISDISFDLGSTLGSIEKELREIMGEIGKGIGKKFSYNVKDFHSDKPEPENADQPQKTEEHPLNDNGEMNKFSKEQSEIEENSNLGKVENEGIAEKNQNISESRLMILKMLEKGKINVVEAEKLLKAIED